MIIGGLLAAFALWLIFIGWVLTFDEGGHWFLSRLATAAGATILVPVGFLGGFIVELASAGEKSMGRGLLYGLLGAGAAAWIATHHWRRLRLDEEPGDERSAKEREIRAREGRQRRADLLSDPAYREWTAEGRPDCDFCGGPWEDMGSMRRSHHTRTGEEVWLHPDCKHAVDTDGLFSSSDLRQMPDDDPRKEARIQEIEDRIDELVKRHHGGEPTPRRCDVCDEDGAEFWVNLKKDDADPGRTVWVHPRCIVIVRRLQYHGERYGGDERAAVRAVDVEIRDGTVDSLVEELIADAQVSLGLKES